MSVARQRSWLLMLVVFALAAVSAVRADAVDDLVQRAHGRHLAEDPEWLRLGHYQPELFGAFKSQVDDPEFFLAPEGKHDPAAELDATIRAFFGQVLTERDGQTLPCVYPARAAWLREALAPLPPDVRHDACPRFDQWRESLGTAGVTLVFPAAYLNNPASMYGHTFLRLDGAGQGEQQRLLAYGASYAAGTTESNGVIFAVKGLAGGYRGAFSISPYYKMVERYSDLENRDIWEYELLLTETEREQMVRHLWELGGTYFDYYFLDENCAYYILALLEVARPTLNLTSEFPLWAIPSETVRAITAVPGLVGKTTFRPAKSTIIRHRRALMSSPDRATVMAVASGECRLDSPCLRQLPEERRTRVIELAFEFLEYQRLRGKSAGPADQQRAIGLLRERSQLPPLSPLDPTPPAVRPDQGHGSSRLAISAGIDRNEFTTTLGLRPAYHDFLDSQAGYISGSELLFGDIEVGWRREESVKLQRLVPIRIKSYSAGDEFLHPSSWRTGIEIRQERTSGDATPHEVTAGELGFGRSVSLFERRILATVLLEGEAKYSEHYTGQDGAVGVGGEVSFLGDLSEMLRWSTSYRILRYLALDEHTGQELGADLRWSLSTDNAAVLSYGHDERFSRTDQRMLLRWVHHW